MKRFFVTMVILTIAGWAGSEPCVRADITQGFSADMVSEFGGQKIEGKIFVSQGNTRMEMPEAVVITRSDRQISWMIPAGNSMYTEQRMDPATQAKVSKQMPGEIERIALGTESIEGKPATKYKVVFKQSGREESIYQWIGESEFPVKVQAIDGSWSVAYRNMRVGPQPDSLFEVPAGCQKIAIPRLPGSMPVAAPEGQTEQ